MTATYEPVLKLIESFGYATTVHRMGDYVELHAVSLPTGDPVFQSRADGDSDDLVYVAALELARMVRGAE